MKLLQNDIQALLSGYAKKQYRPSEVIAECLENIKKSDKQFNAFLELKPEECLSRAKKLDSQDPLKLPLYGVPLAIKDNFLVSGWKATAGSRVLYNYVSPYTATSVERLERAGAIIVGKTNCDEFAMGSSNENSAFGPCRNPWDLSCVPGGSSGGSAVAVAAGFASASLGTDTGGSIRQPASLCGVVGLKPTYGRVSRCGIVAYASSLDQVGSFGKTTWDCARMLEVMGGFDPKDATSSSGAVPQYTAELGNRLESLTIGVAREWLRGVESSVLNSFESAIEQLKRAGTKIVDISLPNSKYALSVYYLIAPSEASSNLARYDGVHYGYRSPKFSTSEEMYCRSRGEGIGKEVKLRIMLGTYALSAGYYDAFYVKANQVRRLIQKDFEQAYQKCQVIAVPTSPSTAFKLGEKTDDPIQMYLSDIFTLPVNLAGLPGISVPCGLDSKGLPVGLQLIGKHFDEATLFQVSHQFEKLRGPFPLPEKWESRS